jgi:integrase/recombinase XerD
MSALSDAARDYLRLRNSLGHELAEYHRELPRFVAVLDGAGLPTVTVAAALSWAQGPDVDPASSIAPRRMTIARGFARYLAGIDARTEVPPPGLISGRRRWRPPFIYSPDDIAMLLAQARRLRQPMPAATHETLIGLLAASGVRVGEAIRLDRGDIDRYARVRDQFCTRTTSSSFFVSMTGTRVIYQIVQQTFRRLCDSAGIGADAASPPRIHDLRHSFAVHTLLDWYRSGADVEAQLPTLSTYLGHRDPRSTYWYLSAAPELLARAAQRLESSREVTPR